MAVKTYAENFISDIDSCSEIQNAGSILKVGNLVRCENEPRTYELTLTAAVVVGDDSISVYITSPTVPVTPPAGYIPPSVFLQKGTKLYFGNTFISVTVAADTVVDGTTAGAADTVPIDPAETAIASGGTAQTWALQMVLSPTDLPITDNDSTVDRTDLTYGLQGSTVKTNKEKSSQITIIARPNDRAFWNIVYPASQGAQNIFVHIIRTGGLSVFGSAKVMSLTMPGVIREILRPQFTLNFQSPFSAPPPREYITNPVQQNAFDTVMRLSGV